MTHHSRFESLMTKHRDLEAALAAEMKRPLPDTLVVQKLKRTKLVVKDELAEWSLAGLRESGRAVSHPGSIHA